MSLFTVSIRTLEVLELHPNADRLELAVVGGFRAVVGRGTFQPGDRVVYLPTDAIVPEDVATALNVGTYLVGASKNRVKAIRLRGVLSEGIVVPLDVVAALLLSRAVSMDVLDDGVDLAEALGIVAYVEPVPVHMSGEQRSWPSFVPHYGLENIKRPEFRTLLVPGEPVMVTEKRHGANMTVAFGPGLEPDEPAFVCSHNCALKDAETSLYWNTARQHGLIEKLSAIRVQLESEGVVVESLSLHGETLGCQDLRYGASMQAPGFEAFDLRVNGVWLDAEAFRARCAAVGVPLVPVLFAGPFDLAALDGLAEGAATGMVTKTPAHLREGVVVRPLRERWSMVTSRVQLKYVSGSYLTRKGGTEMH